MLKERTGYPIVEPAHMELAEPSIHVAFNSCVLQGANRVIVSPFFLLPGRHLNQDIPSLTAEAAKEHPGVSYIVTTPLGLHPLLVMLEPVVAISQLKSQLKRRKCLSSSKGTLSDIDARNAHAKRPKRSSSFSSTSLPALSIPTNLESSKELGHMEQQLEKLLDTVMASCRNAPTIGTQLVQIPLMKFMWVLKKRVM
ncbi:sirohydrochlorin cobaltochelatase-like [Prunus dulcis]|uniref:sirohydrochlorin cobaltochelatase-like n=1 Tax=Prunus dulcis TaxID=3755 RepID=UPI001482018B|nr:sirohydrochlorin cobaltochelatase-like [Prunus dulcis]